MKTSICIILLSICIILLSICLSSRREAKQLTMRASLEKIEDNYIRQNPSKAVKQAMEGIPGWVKEYMAWHSEQRKNNLNDPSTKFLTVVCFLNENCRGVSDRIRPMPYYVLLAYKLQRVLFIKWQKFELEDFLLPPPGGLDWRLPEGVDIGEGWNYYIKKEHINIWDDADEFVTNTKNLVVGWVPDIYNYKDFQKNYFITEQRPNGSFSDLIDILFMPSPPVAAMIRATMKKLGLIPKQYAAAQYRAPDHKHSDPEGHEGIRIPNESTKEEMNKAISCAISISNETNVYFTSSETSYVEYVLEESPFSKSPLYNVTGATGFERFHSGKLRPGYNFIESNPSILYPVFVDLWLMKNSKCVAHGMLGFGVLGSRLTGEHCSICFLTNDCPSIF